MKWKSKWNALQTYICACAWWCRHKHICACAWWGRHKSPFTTNIQQTKFLTKSHVPFWLCSLVVWRLSSNDRTRFITCKIHKSIYCKRKKERKKERKVVCFVLFVMSRSLPNHGAHHHHALGIIEKPLMSRILWRWFCNFQTYDARYICIEYISCCNLLLQSKIEPPITKHILIIEQFSMFSSFFN